MRILATGGGGFIGAWIVRRFLAAGNDIRVFDVKDDRRLLREIVGDAADKLDWHLGDLRDENAVRRAVADCDAIVHLAGVRSSVCTADPVLATEINLIGTLNLFRAAKLHHLGQLVYMSSISVYGADVDKCPCPTSHYGVLKLACEGAARAYWQNDGIASVGLRPFAVYGLGREDGNTAGPSLACRAAVGGESYTIAFTGSADFVYVEDVAAAVEAAVLKRPPGAHVFDIVGEVASVGDIIREIRAVIPGADLTARGPLQATLISNEHTESARAHLASVLPGLPRTSLADGLRMTIEYYRASRARTATGIS